MFEILHFEQGLISRAEFLLDFMSGSHTSEDTTVYEDAHLG